MTDSARAPTGSVIETRRDRWLGIQYLRGVAACGVMIYHFFDSTMAPAGRSFEIGTYGVDLFFVISGFIMYTVARTEPVPRFLERRLSRIYPLYWVATLLQVAIYWLATRSHPSGTEMVKSLALWPHYNEAHRAEIWPVLVPGWTLSYELYFYSLFAIGLLGRRPVLLPAGLILFAIGAGLLAGPHAAVLRVATNWMLGEFVCGLIIGAAVARNRLWLAPIAVGLAGACAAWLATGHGRFGIASAAALIVTLVVMLEASRRFPDRAWLRVTGDASYAIYLFHFPIYLLLTLFVVPIVPSIQGTWPFAITAIGGTFLLCVLLHFLLERPLLRITHRAGHRLGLLLARRRNPASTLPAGGTPG